MSQETAISSRQKRVDRYLRATDFGTAAMLLYPAIAFGLPYAILHFQDTQSMVFPVVWFFGALIILFLELATVLYVFFRRKTDEFTLAMWQSGATYAFFAAVLWLLIGGWVEGFLVPREAILAFHLAEAESAARFDEMRDLSAITNEDLFRTDPQIIERFATPVIIGAFFIGQQVKRFRGGI